MIQSPRRNLQRSRSDRMLAGVCGGIAVTTRLDSTIVRLLTVLIVLSSMGSGLLLYFILALVMPLEPAAMVGGSESLAENVGGLAAADSAEDVSLPASTAAAFTPDELRRWDLPGAAAAARSSSAEPSTAAVQQPGSSAEGGV